MMRTCRRRVRLASVAERRCRGTARVREHRPGCREVFVRPSSADAGNGVRCRLRLLAAPQKQRTKRPIQERVRLNDAAERNEKWLRMLSENVENVVKMDACLLSS